MLDANIYQPMICPVCGEFEFTELQEADLLHREFVRCSVCGWKNDRRQQEDPDCTEGLNALSLNEYRVWYRHKLEENPEYESQEEDYEPSPHPCPVCGRYEFTDTNSFDICPYCGWCDDALMEREPDKWAGNANDLCLTDFRDRYLRLRRAKPDYEYQVDGFSVM